METGFKERLQEAMNTADLRQVDLINKCKKYEHIYGVKFNRSDISQYLSGKFEPSQRKIVVIAKVLNVSETWLLGLTDNPSRENTAEQALADQVLLEVYHSLPTDKQELALKMIRALAD